MYTAGTPYSSLQCGHGDEPPSAPLECLQCEQRRRSARIPGVRAGACCGPLAVWLSELVIQCAGKWNENILKKPRHWHVWLVQQARTGCIHRTMSRRYVYEDLVPSGWEKKKGGLEGICVVIWNEPGESEREEHMQTVKRVIQQPLWYPPLVWLQLAWSLVKNDFLVQRNPRKKTH